MTKVMRAYRQVFFPKKPWSVPKRNTFQRLLDRFETDAAVRPIKPAGKSPVTLAEVVRVEPYFKVNKKNHIRQAVQDLGFSFGKIWKILRKSWVEGLLPSQGAHPHPSPHGVQALSLHLLAHHGGELVL